jgi:hypothetical protein
MLVQPFRDEGLFSYNRHILLDQFIRLMLTNLKLPNRHSDRLNKIKHYFRDNNCSKNKTCEKKQALPVKLWHRYT